MKIGKIREIPLRELWRHEALEFTPWLSQPENLESLSEVLQMSLVDSQTEQKVGPYSCDILCRDASSNKLVVIENQYGKTDHDHLGKIITYASGAGASYVVWIAEKAVNEHRSAIEWLNNNTIEGIGFFLIQIKAIRIGDSDAAPMFEIIQSPNDWSKQVKKTVAEGLTKSNSLRLAFWENLNVVLGQRKNSNLKPKKPSINHWCDFSIGSTHCIIRVELVGKDGFVRINCLMPDNKAMYDLIYSHKVQVDSSFQDIKLIWNRSDDLKESRISTTIDGLDLNNPESYNDTANKILDMAERFKDAFSRIAKKYNLHVTYRRDSE